jgi:hypothetical protein
MSLKTGDEIDQLELHSNPQKYFKAVEDEIGKPVADAAVVNIGNDRHVLFVGLPGKSNSASPQYLAVGKKRVPVPNDIEKTYDEYMAELPLYLQNKDESRKIHMQQLQDKLKEQSKNKHKELRKSLIESSSPKDRGVAAYALGLAACEQADFDALSRASLDSSDLVRNNSTRELAENLQENPAHSKMLSSRAIQRYVDMVNSNKWLDRNKAAFLLEVISKKRDPRALTLIKANAIQSLKEMLSWPDMYWYPALYLLGRAGGISEDKLDKLVSSKDVSAILESLKE